MKKISLATIKSFINKNKSQIYLKQESDFDGYTDCVQQVKDDFSLCNHDATLNKNTLGLKGAWFVLQGRDYFRAYEDEQFTGFYIYNCCGSFSIVIKKNKIEDAA